MIKNFEEYINEDYFSKLASRKDNGEIRLENAITKDFVRSFIENGCEDDVESISFRKENGETVVDIVGNFYFRVDIEEIPFKFGNVTGHFSCAYCEKLKSLEGCPEKVGGDFYCSYCCNLTSLEGGPKEVGGDFNCTDCRGLVSLKGSPEKVGTSFWCSYCTKITSLEGSPQEVGGEFHCRYCGKKFTEEEVKTLCNVKKTINV